MLEENEVTRGLVGRYVETYAVADGRLDVRWKGHSLPYRVFDKDQRVTLAAITENKRLGELLIYIKERQEQQTKPAVKTNSEKNGYVRREAEPYPENRRVALQLGSPEGEHKSNQPFSVREVSRNLTKRGYQSGAGLAVKEGKAPSTISDGASNPRVITDVTAQPLSRTTS